MHQFALLSALVITVCADAPLHTDDELLTISVYSEKYGGFDMTVPLRDTHVTGGDR